MSFMLAALAFHADLRRPGRDDMAPVRKLVLQAFCHECQDNGVIASKYAGKTSNDRLAAIVMRGTSAVKEAKRQLVEDRWLIQVGHARRGQGKVALYRVNVDLLRANVRAREAEIFAVEPEDRGSVIHDLEGGEAEGAPESGPETGENVSGRKSEEEASQALENEGPEKFSGRTSGHQTGEAAQAGAAGDGKGDLPTGQGAETSTEPGMVAGSSATKSPPGENPGLVAGSSAFSGRKSGHNPINPSPPYSPPPSGSAGEDRGGERLPHLPDWREVRDGLAAGIGRERARTLLAGTRMFGTTLLFSNRFTFADARDRHADRLKGLGVSVIAMDDPGGESVALDHIVHAGKRAMP